MEFDENNEKHVNAYEQALERGREEWERRLDEDFPTLTFRWAYSSTVEVEVSCDEDGLDDLEFDNIEVDLSDHGDPEDILNESDLAYAAGDNVREVILEAKSEEWANEHWEEFLEEESPEEVERRKLEELRQHFEGILDQLGATMRSLRAVKDIRSKTGYSAIGFALVDTAATAIEGAIDFYVQEQNKAFEALRALEASKAPQEPPEDAVFVLGPEPEEGSE